MKNYKQKIRVLLVDDHPLVLAGMRSCLETYDHVDVVGEAKTGREALDKAAELKPDIVLIDINLPELNGLEVTEYFKERMPDIKILLLTMHDNREYIARAIRNGANGYILKDVSTDEVVVAIEAVNRGGTYFSSGVSEILLHHDLHKIDTPLTDREQSILLMLANGKSNKHISRDLDISVRTVETHRRNIKRKLNVSSTAGLTKYVIQNGLMENDGM